MMHSNPQVYTDVRDVPAVRKESAAQKQRVARLENCTCQVWSFRYEYTNEKGKRHWIIHVDRIVEKSAGGGEELSNLWVLCPNCHTKKTYGVVQIDVATQTVKGAGVTIRISDDHLFGGKV